MTKGAAAGAVAAALGIVLGLSAPRLPAARVVHAQAALPHVEPVYRNSGSLTMVQTESASDLEVNFEIPVPAGAQGITGWKLAAYSPRRDRLWVCNVTLRVGEEDYDDYKTRGSGQQPPHWLPSGLLISLPPPTYSGMRVYINARFFNEDPDVAPIPVRANAWVWFAVQ